MSEEMNTTNGGGGMSEQSPEPMPAQAGDVKRGSSGKIIAIVVIVLIIAGAVYAWSRRAPQGEETVGGVEQGAEQGAQTGQPVPGEGNVPATEVATSTGDDGDYPGDEAVIQRGAPSESMVTVTFTDGGYSPKTLTIKAGTTVNFKNESDVATWPASAMHPAHTAYPGSDINKCGTGGQSTIFDACGVLNKGESWAFKFDNVGSWKYHDHLTPSHFGTIVVTE